MKLWSISAINKQKAAEIQTKYGLPPIAAMLLQIRGITSEPEIKSFLGNEVEIADPYIIKDMDKAVDRIRRAVENYERICVYGDYDADGVTSTALMYSYLTLIGADAMYYIPSRESEGYGMNKSAVEYLYEKGVRLIVTVDNGIAASEEIKYASSLGIDTVVTDHHMPSGELPRACAVVDLHRADCPSEFKHLSGVGVAFKVIMAMENDPGTTQSLLDNYSDLLAIGTIGDIVELKSENRVFVKQGLNVIENTERIGLDKLVEKSGLAGKKIGAGDVAFKIVPRINAAGRLELSDKSVSLFLTENIDEAEEISERLCLDNSERQRIEKDILYKIDERVRRNPFLLSDRVVVIDGENWHPGVIGIVASRVKESCGKPVIIISRSAEKAVGSGRSVEGFPLCDAVFACSDLLEHCGGHPMAAGMSLKSENTEAFRKKINEWAVSFGKMPYDSLKIDCKLNPAYLGVDLAKSLEILSPFGAGNPVPVFGLFGMKLKSIIPMSGNKHLRLLLTRNGSEVTALMFSTSTEKFPYKAGDTLDFAVTLSVNLYNGSESLSVVVKDVRPSGVDYVQMTEDSRTYDDLCTGAANPNFAGLLPTRDDFALVYRLLRAEGGYFHSVESLAYRLDNKINFGKIKVILEAMRELRLIEYTQGLFECRIALRSVSGKADLSSAPVIRKIREELR